MKGKVGWAEAIQKAFSQEADEIPPGWQTLEQIAAELKKNKYHVCRELNLLVKLGRAETKKFRTWVKGSEDARGPRRGYVRLNRHYRLVNPPERRAGASQKRG